MWLFFKTNSEKSQFHSPSCSPTSRCVTTCASPSHHATPRCRKSRSWIPTTTWTGTHTACFPFFSCQDQESAMRTRGGHPVRASVRLSTSETIYFSTWTLWLIEKLLILRLCLEWQPCLFRLRFHGNHVPAHVRHNWRYLVFSRVQCAVPSLCGIFFFLRRHQMLLTLFYIWPSACLSDAITMAARVHFQCIIAASPRLF